MNHFLVDAYIFKRTVEYLLQSIVWNLFYWCLQFTIVFLKYCIYLPENHLVFIFPKRNDTPLVDTQFLIRNNLIEIYLVDYSKSFTMRTGSLR